MRIFVLVLAAIETLFWVGAIYWSRDPSHRFDPAGAHFFFIFFVLPAAGLALWGRWLKLAVGLVCAVAFIIVAVLVGSQISS